MATLSAAIKQIPSLTGKLKHGLQALRKNHRNAISPENSRKLSGSIDIDTALKSKYPNDHRWDYCIGVRKNRNADSLVWIEFHHSDQGDMAQAMACRPRQAIKGVDEDKNRPEMGANRAGGNPASQQAGQNTRTGRYQLSEAAHQSIAAESDSVIIEQ